MNSSITMANWWSHSVNNLLINFKTSVFLLKWRILEYICSYWWSVLNNTKSMFTSIIRFSEILSFLLGDSSSISTLDEDNEGVWKTENVSFLVANVAAMYRHSNCHFLIHYLQLRNWFQYLHYLKVVFSLLKNPSFIL